MKTTQKKRTITELPKPEKSPAAPARGNDKLSGGLAERTQAAQALGESETLFRTAFENGAIAMALTSLEGKLLKVNSVFCRMLGFSEPELVGRNVAELTHPEDVAASLKGMRQLCHGEAPSFRMEKRYVRKDGTVIWADMGAAAMRDAQGMPLYFVTHIQDITEHKRAEEALLARERHATALVNAITEPLLVLDLEGTILVVNAAMARRLKQSPAELLGKNVYALLPVRIARRRKAQAEEVIRSGRPLRYDDERDGAVLDSHIYPELDAEGKVRVLVVFAMDVTRHKRAEEALRHSERRLKRSQEIAHLGSWELDLETDCLTWSDEVYRIFGLQPQQFGATYEAFLETVHPDDRRAVDAAYSGSLREGRDTYEIEHRVIRKSTGELRIVQEKCEHIRDGSGRIVRSVGIVHDITERRQAEEALARAKAELERHNQELERRVEDRTAKLQKALAEMDHFSYAIIHDLRAPLRAMRSYAEMAEEECSGCQHPLGQSYLKRIRAASGRMDNLIRDSLSYSKAIREELPLKPVDAGNLLRDLIETYPHLQPDQADIEVAGDFPPVLGNEAGLTQCFGNLLDNAVKFAKPGTKPQIRVWAERGTWERGSVGASERQTMGASGRAEREYAPTLYAPQASHVRIWVEDHGIGIPQGFHQRIFDMFQRGTNYQEGTGIGLAIVQKVVQRMGGRVGVESEEGQGSRFWVELAQAP